MDVKQIDDETQFEHRLIAGLRFRLGSARVSRKQASSEEDPRGLRRALKRKFAIGRRNRQTREARALPRQDRRRARVERVKKFFAASEKVPILRVSASVA